MVEILQTLREKALDDLGETAGKKLELTANLTANSQIELVLECYAHERLGSTYVIGRKDMLLRLTNSYQGRHRSDVVEIAKTPDFAALK